MVCPKLTSSCSVAEMKNPSRDLPRALLMGIPLVVVVYVLANIAYFAVLETSEIVNFVTGETNEGFAGYGLRCQLARPEPG